MWVYLIIQGVIGCAVLVWFAAQDWPTHLLVALLGLPFPVLFIFGGFMLGRREREQRPQRKAYLESNEVARRELNRAGWIKWTTFGAVLLFVVLIGRTVPGDYQPSPTLTWVVAGILLAAIVIATLYSSLVRDRIEDEATRQHAGQPPLTPDARRKRTIWFVAALALLVGIIAFDQFVPSPVSALTVFGYGALILAGAAFVWRRLNPPRDRK